MEQSPHERLKTAKEVLTLYIPHVIGIGERKSRSLGLDVHLNTDYDNAHAHVDKLLDDYSEARQALYEQPTVAFEPIESD